MCPKDVVDICVPRRDDHNRLKGPPIIELELNKETLDLHIIIGGHPTKNEKEEPTLCVRCFQFGHPKKFCRSNRELCRKKLLNWRGIFAFTAKKKPTRQETRKYVENIQWKTTIQNEMRLYKCDVCTVKKTLEYRGESSTWQQQRKRKTKEGQEEKQIHKQMTQ